MPHPEFRWRQRNQTLHRGCSKRKISLKNLPNARNTTNKVTTRIKHFRTRFAKEDVQISINKLRDRQQIISQFLHKCDVFLVEVVVYLDDAGTKNFTLLVIPKSHIVLMWKGNEAGKSFLITGHVSWAIEGHQPLILQASVHHLHRMREGRWLNAGVSEKNLRNTTLNHTTRGSLHSLFHHTIWASETWTMTGKAWIIEATQLKVRIDTSRGKTMPRQGTNTTMRMLVNTKASMYKATLSWTKTIWAMVSSMRQMRWSTRGNMRQKISKSLPLRDTQTSHWGEVTETRGFTRKFVSSSFTLMEWASTQV
jgi:hypothetical protein